MIFVFNYLCQYFILYNLINLIQHFIYIYIYQIFLFINNLYTLEKHFYILKIAFYN
jgi:hypothetical protein